MENVIHNKIGDIDILINEDERRCLLLVPSYKLGLDPIDGKEKLEADDYNNLIKWFGYSFERVVLNKDKVALIFNYGNISSDECFKVATNVNNNITRAYYILQDNGGDEELRLGENKSMLKEYFKPNRYVVTVDYHLQANDDKTALKIAKSVVPEFLGDELYNGSIVEIGEQPFGEVGNYRKIYGENSEINSNVLKESFVRSLNRITEKTEVDSNLLKESFTRSLNERILQRGDTPFIALREYLEKEHNISIEKILDNFEMSDIEITDEDPLTYKIDKEYELGDDFLEVMVHGQEYYMIECSLKLINIDGSVKEINNCIPYVNQDVIKSLYRTCQEFVNDYYHPEQQ